MHSRVVSHFSLVFRPASCAVLSLTSHSFLSEAAFLSTKFYVSFSISSEEPPPKPTPSTCCSHVPQLRLRHATGLLNLGPSEPPRCRPRELLL